MSNELEPAERLLHVLGDELRRARTGHCWTHAMTWMWVRDRGVGPFHAVSEDADTTSTMLAVCLEKISPTDLQLRAFGEKIDRGTQCEYCLRVTSQLAQADRAGDGPDGKPTPEQLRAAYEDGQSILDLATRHHMATKTVRARIVRAGGVLRPSAVQSLDEDRVAYNRAVLDALARQSVQELTCADIAKQLGLAYTVTYRTLQRLDRADLVTSREPAHGDGGRRPYRLTQTGIDQTGLAQTGSTAPEPPITAITAQILLVLLQPPIRSWHAANLANRVSCHLNTVVRLAAAMERAGWATTEHDTQRVDIRLTEHGVNCVKAALQREYGDGPALALLANAIRPPVSAVWE